MDVHQSRITFNIIASQHDKSWPKVKLSCYFVQRRIFILISSWEDLHVRLLVCIIMNTQTQQMSSFVTLSPGSVHLFNLLCKETLSTSIKTDLSLGRNPHNSHFLQHVLIKSDSDGAQLLIIGAKKKSVNTASRSFPSSRAVLSFNCFSSLQASSCLL